MAAITFLACPRRTTSEPDLLLPNRSALPERLITLSADHIPADHILSDDSIDSLSVQNCMLHALHALPDRVSGRIIRLHECKAGTGVVENDTNHAHSINMECRPETGAPGCKRGLAGGLDVIRFNIG